MMSKAWPNSLTDELKSWLIRDRYSEKLDENGFPYFALQTDQEYVKKLNIEVNEIIPDWPEDFWVIGEDGAGNYFVVSKSHKNEKVIFWDHEWKKTEEEFNSIREFYDYVISIHEKNE